MRIRELYRTKKPVVSFEVFPPKRDADIAAVYGQLEQTAALRPDFISVTYGAGGDGNANRTCEIASRIRNLHGAEALAHLTCIASRREQVEALARELRDNRIENILALRGDRPAGRDLPPPPDYRYASGLIRDLKEMGGFCIGAACYPEGHIDSRSLDEDILHLREKQEAGADFLITQLFFDNALFWRFLEKIRVKGIALPVSAGVMPILSRGQIERMIFLCGTSLPSAIIKLLHRYEHSPADLREAGIEHAARQMEELASGGADGIHVYTMNHPDIAAAAMRRLRP